MKPNTKRLKTRLAIRHQRAIRQAIRASVSVSDIVEAWFSNFPEGSGTVTPDEARAWARIHVIVNTQTLRNTLFNLYADSAILGIDLSAYGIARKAKVNKAAPSKKDLQRALAINWDTWRPGNRAAALRLRPSATLYDLLNRGVSMSDEITMTTVKRIGTILARTLTEGKSPRDTAILIDQLIDDPIRALSIAQTETSYAVVQSSLDLYRESGVEMIEYLVADPCDLCSENEAASPIQLGQEWPNGDPPVHPNCMCDVAPYVVDTKLINE
jgi:hypothetical protein